MVGALSPNRTFVLTQRCLHVQQYAARNHLAQSGGKMVLSHEQCGSASKQFMREFGLVLWVGLLDASQHILSRRRTLFSKLLSARKVVSATPRLHKLYGHVHKTKVTTISLTVRRALVGSRAKNNTMLEEEQVRLPESTPPCKPTIRARLLLGRRQNEQHACRTNQP